MHSRRAQFRRPIEDQYIRFFTNILVLCEVSRRKCSFASSGLSGAKVAAICVMHRKLFRIETALTNFSSCFRICVGCGAHPKSYFGGPMCAKCEKFLLEKSSIHSRIEDGWSSHSLWPWVDEASVVGRTVRRLKGGGPPQTFDYYTNLFWSRWLQKRGSQIDKSFLFVPAPARDFEKDDHASCLAKSFARETRGEFAKILKRVSQEQQKLRGKSERQQTEMEFVPMIDGAKRQMPSIAKRTVIFVDDVIVTGSTARAAYEALGRPPRFMTWCLADRIRTVAKPKGPG